jgi:voltage-gated potassium channel
MKVFLKGKWSHLTSPSTIIDLLAILPAYRPLRVLRIFVLFRVFKLLRYTKSIHQFVEVLATKRFELYTLLFLLLFIVLTAGIAIYVFEEQSNPTINSLFDAIYWALVTISTVGYGDISPVTHEGRVVSMMIIISGIAMISFVTSVIVSAFSEKLTELKENRIIEEINKNEAFIIICGYGQMTRMFLKNSDLLPTEYVIIEQDSQRVELGVKEGYNIIHDDASKHDVISRFNIAYAKITILALTGSDVNNIYIALNAKALSRNIKVIARATNKNMEKKCKLAGVDHVVLPNMAANHMLLFAITQPTIYRAIYNILTNQHLAHIDEVKSVTHLKLVGKRVDEIEFKSYKLLFLGIQGSNNASFCFNPPPSRVIVEGDILLIMGRKVSIDYFQTIFQEV